MQLTKRQQQIFDIFLEMPSEPRTISDFTELGPERTTIFRDIKKLAQAFTEAYGKSAGRYGELISYINDGGMPGTIS
ncbi:hypothetical protein HBZ99_004085 [Salmonella enterica subsp. enterica]|uniref:Uncharacterized protein n=1 Tax=Salmonella enterica subsp. enterica serovar Java TaxID=224729 RepID=A0A3Z6QTH9_SALEB|nr:hypothetical protein [Salmonella enterica subsp. enterica serovar Java]EBK4665395.1 hypothetical protein [Salmonella enterica]ECA4660995.1 hypothetical protein [Salmonella enterica subsp. enterica serovar Cerro]EEP4266239.1 hypothetical protein [Salmonella enterica subsp. enterica serovar Oranienburg]HBM0024007.1 hypothetical protein [Salmonella enterica subsp. enterica serovar Muenchen]